MDLFLEIKRKTLLDHASAYIETDFNNSATEQESFLYRVVGGNIVDRYDFFTEAKTIFFKKTFHKYPSRK